VIGQRLALGTAQFGLDYGVTNRAGQVPQEKAKAILCTARSLGVDTVDTAMAYGQSESVLGRCELEGWQVVTKLPPVPDSVSDVAAWVHAQVAQSRARLGLGTRPLRGLLLHRPGQLLEPMGPALLGALRDLQQAGAAQAIGVSIYDPAELPALMAVHRFDLVQAPLSILDRRMLTSGWAPRLADQGVALHARSAFLQGLLLDQQVQRDRFPAWQHLWDFWQAWLGQRNLSAVEACIRFLMAVPQVEKIVLGFDSPEQLRQVLAIAGAPLDVGPRWPEFEPRLLNPAAWGTL